MVLACIASETFSRHIGYFVHAFVLSLSFRQPRPFSANFISFGFFEGWKSKASRAVFKSSAGEPSTTKSDGSTSREGIENEPNEKAQATYHQYEVMSPVSPIWPDHPTTMTGARHAGLGQPPNVPNESTVTRVDSGLTNADEGTTFRYLK